MVIWFSSPTRIGKLLSHDTLYRRIVGVEGEAAECGVFKWASLIRWATFRHLYELGAYRKIVGFDAFGNFPIPDSSVLSDVSFVKHFETEAGKGLSTSELYTLLDKKGIGYDCSLICGDVFVTISKFLDTQHDYKIALLHVDVDVYGATKFVLESLWPHVSSGGVVILDDYLAVEGATVAIDEFAASHDDISIQRLPTSAVPHFTVKK